MILSCFGMRVNAFGFGVLTCHAWVLAVFALGLIDSVDLWCVRWNAWACVRTVCPDLPIANGCVWPAKVGSVSLAGVRIVLAGRPRTV